MSEEKIPTAKEFLADYDTDLHCQGPVYSSSGYSYDLVLNIMRDFAEIHRAAALKSAAEKATVRGRNPTMSNMDVMEVDPNSILTAYPPENIK